MHAWLLLILGLGAVALPSFALRQPDEGSLKSALHAVTRKQRSLDSNAQDYYDVHSFKYRGGNAERKYERGQPAGREFDREEGDIEFLPIGGLEGGQLETIGDGFQIPSINNNILFGKSLIDYLDNPVEHGNNPTSLFRERERKPNSKRTLPSEYQDEDDKELVKVFLEGLEKGPLYTAPDMDESDYLELFQNLYDRYRREDGNVKHENGAMPWSELFDRPEYSRSDGRFENDDENFSSDRDREENVLYVMPAERRIAESRFSPANRDAKGYRVMSKRYPITKRSPATHLNMRQFADSKVAQDLGALLATDNDANRTRKHDRNAGASKEHEHARLSPEETRKTSTTSSTAKPHVESQQEKHANVGELATNKPIELKKKNVDWSDYFGIDRRRKKTTFLAKPDTQSQDDEWLLQRYYKTMAENLKSTGRNADKEASEKPDTFTQMDSRLKKIKDLIIEEALKYTGSEEGANLQEVKDKVISRLAAAYSIEKMRRALNEFRSNLATQRESLKASNASNNVTKSYREHDRHDNAQEKRTAGNNDEDDGTNENKGCVELTVIEKRCRTVDTLAGDDSRMLYLPCVILQICRACVMDDTENECFARYAVETSRICDEQSMKETCTSKALVLSQLEPPTAAVLQCRANGSDSCLRRIHYRYLHRYVHNPRVDDYVRTNYEAGSTQLSDR